MTENHDTSNSVIGYLSSLVWDGTPRLERWLIDYVGTSSTPQTRDAGRDTLVAVIGRARHRR